MSHLTFGILGAAKIADRYTIAAMLATEGVEVAGVAARDRARARALAEKFGIGVFDSYDDVIASPNVNAVYIPLPIGLHKEWAIKALEAGKHVLCEKSLTGRYEDCAEVIELARERGLALLENFMCETHPQSIYVRDAVAAGSIGRVWNASLSFGFPPFPADDLRNSAELEGGALNDAGAYCFDMAMFYLGKKPVSVFSVTSNHNFDVDIIGSSMIVFDDQSTANLTYGFSYDYRNEVRLWGESGQIDIDRAFSIPADRLPTVTITRNTVAEPVAIEAANQFETQIARFGSLVAGEGREAALDRMHAHALLMHASRVSAAENRLIEMSEFAAWATVSHALWGDDVS